MIAFLVAGLIVYFQYYHQRKINFDLKILSVLRFISIFCILILLVNPKFEQKSTENYKPVLLLGVDNSNSINYLNREQLASELRGKLLENKDLQERFDVSVYNFGSGISTDTVLNFQDSQTDIYKLVNGLNAMSTDQTSALVLLTDGNQTLGRNYTFMSSKNPVYPVVLGDTLLYDDIEISKVNVNAYASLDNNFQVELFLNSRVSRQVNSKLTIAHDGKSVYTTDVRFSKNNSSVYVDLFLEADSVGMQLYTAELTPFQGERDIRNNNFNFGVEILDEQTEVVIVHNIVHPDLGMIKRSVETNKQRKAKLVSVQDFDANSNRDAVLIMYQPDVTFKEVFEQVEVQNANYLIITGSHTDWNFLNTAQVDFSKKTSGIIENIFPVYKNDFSTFYTEDLGYQMFPPLLGALGEIQFKGSFEVLLTQKMNDIATNIPLLVAYDSNNVKRIALFGEGIWKWRAESYRSEKSFEKFDIFFNSLIQFLQLSERSKNMELFYEPVYNANENIKIQVKNYDKNLNLELNSELLLRIEGKEEQIPFYVSKNFYEAQLSDYEPGTYQFEVIDRDANKKQSGSFVVIPYAAEQSAQGPNVTGLKQLAIASEGQLFFEDQIELLISELANDETFKSIQKERFNLVSLIDWKWLLALIILSLSLEWLLRKYRGMI
ncbi:hypothetical protein [Lutimonas sp.]|uniref:hypothetical protein n=1 Tax=Lutimonas sp. TaxID=1872403 RepID=UPI003D9B795F